MGTNMAGLGGALASPFLVLHLKHSVLLTKFQLPHFKQSQSPLPFSGALGLAGCCLPGWNRGASTALGSTPASRRAFLFLSSASLSLSYSSSSSSSLSLSLPSEFLLFLRLLSLLLRLLLRFF